MFRPNAKVTDRDYARLSRRYSDPHVDPAATAQSGLATARTTRQSGGVEDWDSMADRLAAQHLADGDPTGWFDPLYRAVAEGGTGMPWDRGHAHGHLVSWLGDRRADPGARAAVVGCGLGADVELLAERGWEVLGFDVSPTAVDLARGRSTQGTARYERGDLFDLPAAWRAAFDLVVEIFTVQALPRDVRPEATAAIASLVAPGGTLLVVQAIQAVAAPVPVDPPWPLTESEVLAFTEGGLVVDSLEVVAGVPGPDDLRWRASFHRPTDRPASVS